MNGHLPECPAGYVADLCTTDIDPVLQEPTCNHCVGQGCICICNRLRACEQRVRLHAALSWEEGFQEGRSSAFDAAREAVARQCGHTKSVSTNYECDHDRAIAAINDLQDALQDDLSRYE